MQYTFVKQHDATDCAAACMAMVCLHYKKETTITKLRDIMGTDIGNPAKDLEKIEIDTFYKNFTGAMILLKPNHQFVDGKQKDSKIFSRYVKLLLPQKKLFLYAIVASFLLVFLGISITQILVSFVRQWILMHLSIKIDIPLMLGYFEHIYKLPMYCQRHSYSSCRRTNSGHSGYLWYCSTYNGLNVYYNTTTRLISVKCRK